MVVTSVERKLLKMRYIILLMVCLTLNLEYFYTVSIEYGSIGHQEPSSEEKQVD
jgi:hypothetical protein